MLSDKETIQACITKAIEGGWEEGKQLLPFDMDTEVLGNPIKHLAIQIDSDEFVNIEAILFDVNFAKALFGLEPRWNIKGVCGDSSKFEITNLANFLYHLQQLAIAEDRISYLRENA